MSQERVVYLNGDIIPESQATVSVRDPGFLRGAAAFDTARTFNGEIFKLKEHLDRFYKSMRYLRIDPGMTVDEMADATHRVVDANLPLLAENDDYWITQRATNGVPGPDGEQRPTVIVMCSALPFEHLLLGSLFLM